MCLATPKTSQEPPSPPSGLDRLLSRMPEGVQVVLGGIVLLFTLAFGLLKQR